MNVNTIVWDTFFDRVALACPYCSATAVTVSIVRPCEGTRVVANGVCDACHSTWEFAS